MQTTRTRTLAGPFALELSSAQWWEIRFAGGSALIQGAAAPGGLEGSAELRIDWQAGGGIQLAFALPSGPLILAATSLILHEPQPELYAALPLARFDARARRFWYRVFALVRAPGGRWLLGLVARLARRNSP